MQKEEIEQIIFQALEMANHSRTENEQIEITSNAKLYGEEGQLESMELVAMLIDIEEELLDAGFKVALSDERAMSMKRSPFADIPALLDYIALRLNDNK